MSIKGFSSVNQLNVFPRRKTFALQGIALVKQDLMNHIYTRPGELPGQPTFGTRIPLMVGRPLIQENIDAVVFDLQTVIKFDPRVKLIDLKAIPLYDRNTLGVKVQVLYVATNTTELWELEVSF